MSTFGDKFVAARNWVEARAETAWDALEPELQTDAVAAAKAAVAAAIGKGGSTGDMLVAARNATEQLLLADGKSIGAALLNEIVNAEFGTQIVPAPAAPAITAEPAAQ